MNELNGPTLPVTLSVDDLRLCIRPIKPDDRKRILEGLRSMSVETSYRRFFTPNFYPTEKELQYLTEVDQDTHVAIGAIDCTRPGWPGIGAARYVRLPENPSIAEAAIVVIDEYQQRGIGSLLLAALSHYGAAHGVDRFRGYVLSDNQTVIDLLRSLGAMNEQAHDSILQLDLPVHPDVTDLPSERAAERTRWARTTLARGTPGCCDEEDRA